MIDRHWNDHNGNPAGGVTSGVGYTIAWQNGPLKENQQNGAMVENIIGAAILRLGFYQNSQFSSDYNERAIAALEIALDELNSRTCDRTARGVEGKYIA